MPDLISIDTSIPQQEEQPISIDSAVNASMNAVPNPDVAAQRTAKTIFGLPGLGSYGDVLTDYISGREEQLRRSAASLVDFQKSMETNKIINDVATRRGGPLSPGEVDLVRRRIQLNKQFTDPNTAIEVPYGKEFVNYLDASGQSFKPSESSTWDWRNTVIGKAKDEIPEQFAQDKAIASSLVAKGEILAKKQQDLEEELKKQPLFSAPLLGHIVAGPLGQLAGRAYKYLGPNNSLFGDSGRADDILTLGVPFYYQGMLRSTIPSEGLVPLLGEAVEAKRKALFKLPDDQFQNRIDEAVKNLKVHNPALALEFIKKMRQYGSSDVLIDNVIGISDFFGIGTGALVTKAVRGVVGKEAVPLAIQSKQAVKDVIKAANSDQSPKVAAAAGAGDMGEAAVQKMMNIIASEFNEPRLGAPTRDAIEALPSFMHQSISNIKATPGRSGQEIVNKIVESKENIRDKFIDKMLTMLKVDRTAGFSANDNAVRLYKEGLKENYRGQENAILDITGPHREKVTNTKYWEYQVGSPASEMWSSRELAQANAKLNRAINPEFRSIGGGHYYVTREAVRENDPLVKAATIVTGHDEVPRSWVNRLRIGYIRTPEDVLSKAQLEANKIATFGKSHIMNLAKESMVSVRNLTKRFNPEVEDQFPVKFTTDYGSTYEIHADGTTTRNKAKGIPGHTDFGLKPRSSKTVYLDPESANLLIGSPVRNFRVLDHGDGTLSLATPNPKKGWGIMYSQRNVPFSTTPQEGLTPLELWGKGKTLTVDSYNQSHFGHPIKSVDTGLSTLGQFKRLGADDRNQNKQRWFDWQRVVDSEKDLINPRTGEKGYQFQTVPELEEHYIRHLGRFPGDDEIEAYFAHTTHTELVDMLRDVSMFSHKYRVGAESHNFVATGKFGKLVRTEPFDAVKLKPGIEMKSDFTVLVQGADPSKGQLYTTGMIPSKVNKLIKSYQQSGQWSTLQVFDPESYPFRKVEGVGDKLVHYVIAPSSTIETKPLSFTQHPRRGSLAAPDYEWDIVQPIIKTEKVGYGTKSTAVNHWYLRDKALMPGRNKAELEAVAKEINAARALIKEGKIDEANAILGKGVLPFEKTEFHSWFNPTQIGDEVRPPRFDTEHDFKVIQRGKLSINVDNSLKNKYTTVDPVSKKEKTTLRDITREGSLARQTPHEYMGQTDPHDVFTLRDHGTKDNPVFKYDPVKYVDPITTINRSLAKMIDSAFMNDVKEYGVTAWLENAKDYVRQSPNELRTSPNYWYQHARFNDKDPGRQIELETARYQLKAFTGTPGKIETTLHSVSQALADATYTTHGPKAMELIPFWAIPATLDVTRALRSAVYHSYLGFFNPTQIGVQHMTFATMLGLSKPSIVLPAMKATMLHRVANMFDSPEVLATLDKIASRRLIPGTEQMAPGTLTEARKALINSGFEHVGGENVLREISPKIIESDGFRFFDTGTALIKWADRNVRIGAYYAAWLERRAEQPYGRFTDADLQQILNNADKLAGNMTKASQSVLQKGVGAFSTQFLGYQMRLAETLAGGRTTASEKIRTIAVLGFLFGYPVSMGASGFPLGNLWRKYALENGITGGMFGEDPYVPGKNFIESWIMEGGISTIGALITGGGDIQKGKMYNIGSRFGNPGADVLFDAFTDKSVLKILSGAAGSRLVSSWEASDGFRNLLMGLVNPKYGQFKPTDADFLTMARELSAINNAWKYEIMLTTGKLLSSKEILLRDKPVSTLEATWLFMSGTQPVDIADLHLMQLGLADRHAKEQQVEKTYKLNQRRAFQALNDNNPQQADRFFTNANAALLVGNYPVEKRNALLASSLDNVRDLATKVKYDYYMKNLPLDIREKMQDTFRTRDKLEQGR